MRIWCGLEMRSRCELKMRIKFGLEMRSMCGLEMRSRCGLEMRSRSRLEMRSRCGLEMRCRCGLEMRSRRGLEIRSRCGLKMRIKWGLEMRGRCWQASDVFGWSCGRGKKLLQGSRMTLTQREPEVRQRQLVGLSLSKWPCGRMTRERCCVLMVLLYRWRWRGRK